jgi:hypothetical protein
MAGRKPIIHARDHGHGGADPVLIAWEDVGTSGGGAAAGGGWNALPQALGLKTWTLNPLAENKATLMSGNPVATAVYLEAGTVISQLAVPIISGSTGSGLTHFQMGIYNSTLALVASTADSPGSIISRWTTVSLTSPYTIPAAGLYYLAYAIAGAGLPTTVAGNTSSNDISIDPLPSGKRSTLVYGTAQGTLPNPISAGGAAANWIAMLAL